MLCHISDFGARMNDQPRVPSPCVDRCCLDDHDVCLGCYRLMSEILRWSAMSDEERLAVIEKAHSRRDEARKKSHGIDQ